MLAVAVALLAAGVAAFALRRGTDDPPTHGARIVRYTLAGRLVSSPLHEIAIVPAGTRRRSLLVLLHGRHDPGPLGFMRRRSTGPDSLLSSALLDGLARLGARAPVVLLLDGGGHSYYHDRNDGRWGSMLLQEAIPDAAQRFGTLPGRTAIGGISMGGYGALLAASRAPRRFCAVGGHSAALWQRAGDSAPGAFDDAADFARNDVFAAAARGRYAGLRVWLDGGTSDPFRAADTAFAGVLRTHGARVTRRLWPGGHDGAYWHAHMAAYLRFYADALARC